MDIATSDLIPQVQTKPSIQEGKADLQLSVYLAACLPLLVQAALLLQVPRAFFSLTSGTEFSLEFSASFFS